MNQLLNPEDYKFFSDSYKQTSETYVFFTNKGCFDDRPSEEIITQITHMRTKDDKFTYSIFAKEPFLGDLDSYSNLRYLDHCMSIEYFETSKLTSLEILILECFDISNKKLLNLPDGLKTLILNEVDIYIRCYNFMLTNLPITMEKIIFIARDNVVEEKNYFLIEILNIKLQECKIPFGCQIYYVDRDEFIYNIHV